MIGTRISSLLTKISVIIVICCFVMGNLCVNTAVALDGLGTEEDPWRIQSLVDFDEFSGDPNYWDDYTRLETDVNLAGRVYERAVIASDVNGPFTGVFDGDEHRIENFTCDSNGVSRIGLFGIVDDPNAEIKNLTMIDPNITVVIGLYTGSLVGWLGNGTITNCHIDGGSISGWMLSGGLVSIVSSEGTVTDCSVKGIVVEGYLGIGGLVGTSRGSINNCHSTATVVGRAAIGGLIGSNTGTIRSSSANATVISSVSLAGGLVGYNYNTISDCYAFGIVDGNNYVGGLVGNNNFRDDDPPYHYYGTIQNSYAVCDVSGFSNVGGLVGHNSTYDSYIINSYWNTDSGSPDNGVGIPKTTTEMKMADTYVSWGCESVWTIDEGIDYPRLLWENMPGELMTIQSNLYGGGTGEPNNPFLIYTAEQLNSIGLILCHLDKHFKLMADIDLSSYTGTDFNIIGRRNFLFKGVFDGNDHTISNFTYNANGPDYYIGLFCHVNDPCAEIKNLGLLDPNMVRRGLYYGYASGLLVGRLSAGAITNCYASNGNVEWISGLVGENLGIVSDCYFAGKVSGGAGLVLRNWGTVTNSSFTGSVEIGDGLVGTNYGTISNCYAAGQVTGADYVGGLCGSNVGGTITNCGTNVAVNGTGAYGYVGGLVGECKGSTGRISDCYATGQVTGMGKWYIGGLVGRNIGTIERCYATGAVMGARSYVGGLVGGNLNGTIHSCYATGQVNGTDHVGGLVGNNSRWYTAISNCYAIGDVHGTEHIGGLCGKNSGAISNCYATGEVDGFKYFGGMCGSGFGGTACFWDIDVGGSDNGLGTPLPTEQMQMYATFTNAGWDFNTPVWTIDDGNDYPHLWWEYVPVLHAEPEITLGTSNTVSWDPINGDIEYYAECSDDADFNNIVSNTGWIIETSCEFTGLELGKRYWYSVKAKNAAGVETDWSNVESSLQCSLSGAVETLLDKESLKNENMKNALLNKIDAAMKMIGQANYTGALSKLENDILQKTNGCPETGQPDKNDWITTCEQQNEIYPLIIETIEHVKALMTE